MRVKDGAKIKVPVATLIRAVQAAREAAVKEHAAAVEQYEKDTAGVMTRAEKALHKALDDLEAGKLPELEENYRRGHYVTAVVVPIGGRAPSKPAPLSSFTGKANRDLALLRAEQRESLMVARDDHWGEYLT